jgi:GNAT-family acetyltransferase (TIGR03103 family)
MVPVPPEFFCSLRESEAITVLVAEDELTGAVLGSITGVDHAGVFNDPERGSSFWCLAVDPQARQPGIGEVLVRQIAEHFREAGARFLDLSVLHDNEQAIALYEKLGFERVPFFTIKRKNQINEKLFIGPDRIEGLNPYSEIIVNEALRRGIHVEVTDAEGGFFRLTHGGRSIHCRESLSELTSGVAVSICDDKAVTRRIVEAAGVKVPAQLYLSSEKSLDDALQEFLSRHGSVVVKPARGEQGRGVAVGLTTREDVEKAIAAARTVSDGVVIEQMIEGIDLRIIVIGFEVVAAAVRRPARVVGNGESTIQELIEKQSRRRSAATHGESRIPLDSETERAVLSAGCEMNEVLRPGREIEVRKTANLHTGGTIHDVTDELHPQLIGAAVDVARAIDIPVVGVDFIVKAPSQPEYAFIEANERPGLANHEPQPTAERFLDLLFPHSIPAAVRAVLARGTDVKT